MRVRPPSPFFLSAIFLVKVTLPLPRRSGVRDDALEQIAANLGTCGLFWDAAAISTMLGFLVMGFALWQRRTSG